VIAYPATATNNRTEAAIGTAHDFWTAHREEAFGKQPRPFVGWLMTVEGVFAPHCRFCAKPQKIFPSKNNNL